MKILKKNLNIPDSMMQVIAWIMGEYGASLPNQKKVLKILDLLAGAAYRTLEDETTRGYILSAITKLHASMNFNENEKVEQVMTDYCQSKHIDVQQKAIEYKQIREVHGSLPNNGKDLLINTPITEVQVAAYGFDFELSFLNGYV
jgi:hypothetical protein